MLQKTRLELLKLMLPCLLQLSVNQLSLRSSDVSLLYDLLQVLVQEVKTVRKAEQNLPDMLRHLILTFVEELEKRFQVSLGTSELALEVSDAVHLRLGVEVEMVWNRGDLDWQSFLCWSDAFNEWRRRRGNTISKLLALLFVGVVFAKQASLEDV